ncbi:Oidioi.mRNA.OKI2018_I69.XSR.g16584.t2.cds [Oikopleura dioica]|uniref:WD repeat-containing protein 44 n=1 Tax=Oikopleura dioica TaxID=34765 RepID=A0ABN7SGK4_OIKDI|nr:Oidioi.mRNA.OKI2018_I69.XSR.g16584.t2.cds [Oikopleura dioica]
MSSSDEFYDAESDTVEDLETPTVEANGCFIPVASDGDNGQVLPKPRLSKESATPSKEKPPRPPPPKFGLSKSAPRPNTLPVNFRLEQLSNESNQLGQDDALLTPNSTVDSITAEFTKRLFAPKNLEEDYSGTSSVESVFENAYKSKTSSLDRRRKKFEDDSKRSSLDSEKMNSRYFSCAELVEELNGDAKLKRDDSIRSSLRSTHSRMAARTNLSLRRDSYRENDLNEVDSSEVPTSAETQRVCEVDNFIAPQSPPNLEKCDSISSLSSEMSSIASSASAMARKVKGIHQTFKSRFLKFRTRQNPLKQNSQSSQLSVDPPESDIDLDCAMSKKSDSSGSLKLKSSKKLLRASSNNLPLSDLSFVQELSHQSKSSPIYILKLNADSTLLAAGGKESQITVFILNAASNSEKYKMTSKSSNSDDLFCDVPFRQYFGHSGDILDLAWSKKSGDDWLLSASSDCSVCLWHMSKMEAILTLKHPEPVKCVCFHPEHPTFFASGSVDGIVRFWDIMSEKVMAYAHLQPRLKNGEMINCVEFVKFGEWLLVGTFDGRVIIFERELEKLNYYTEIVVSEKPVTGISTVDEKSSVLVTSGDSRIRVFSLDSFQMTSRYKGVQIKEHLIISAVYSPVQKLIFCGSEDGATYCWRISSDRHESASKWQRFKMHTSSINTVSVPSTLPLHSSTLFIATGDDAGRISIFSN